jgi:hypothetical protein
MNLDTITMDRTEAREAFLNYRRAVRAGASDKLAEAQREYESIDRAVMQGYKALAGGQQLLRLSGALAAGGVESWEGQTWDGKAVDVEVPKLAVVRADASSVFTKGVDRDGDVIFHANQRESSAKVDRLRCFGAFEPDETRTQQHRTWYRAMVPTIPPPLRPPYKLSGYHLLWEAEWSGVAPVDPALLKHLGGDLFVVLAVWDLSPLEQAVLAGTR